MASASTAQSTLTFNGPAGQKVDSFQHLSRNSLDYYSNSWKNYDDPQSLMIPPIVIYKISDKSDKDVLNDQRETIDRQSDSAEHLIHKALCDLIDDKFLAPFIAVQSANLNYFSQGTSEYIGLLPAHLRDSALRSTFMDCFREYNFIVIGPKIGFLVIEVKSSYFTQKSHFKEGSKKFQKVYYHGIEQLKSANKLGEFLKSFAAIPGAFIVSKKILFTPNLTRERYDKWIMSLTDASKFDIAGEVAGIDQWFQEDAKRLKSMLETLLQSNAGSIHADIYESLAPIIAGLASVKIFRSSVELDASRLRESDAVYRESRRIEQQDPLETLGKRRNPGPMDVILFSTIIFTPKQLEALKQPSDLHLIFGVAGVGKTIILQAKALELLKSGKSITVLANKNYGKIYANLFDRYGYKHYRVEKWSAITSAAQSLLILRYHTLPSTQEQQKRMIGLMEEILDACVPHDLDKVAVDYAKMEAYFIANTRNILPDNAESMSGDVKKLLTVFRATDCVLVDDSFDHEYYNSDMLQAQLAIICLTVIRMRKADQKLLWIALDPYAEFSETRAETKRECRMAFLDEDGEYKDKFTMTFLNRVLRCPQTVYDVSYEWTQNLTCSYASNDPDRALQPELGHKIQGAYKAQVFEDDASSFHNVLCNAKRRLYVLLAEVHMQGYNFDQLAVITIEEGDDDHLYRSLSKAYKDHFRAILQSKYENKNTLEDMVNRTANIFTCYQVSSMEWPIVVVIVYARKGWLARDGAYRYYRACSRATGKLFVVKMARDDTPFEMTR